MAIAEQMKTLGKSHAEQDDTRFYPETTMGAEPVAGSAILSNQSQIFTLNPIPASLHQP